MNMDMDDACDSEEETDEEREERRVLRVQESVGAEVEVASCGDGSYSLVNYTLPAGCSTPLEGEGPLDFFSLLLTNSMLDNIVALTYLSAQ